MAATTESNPASGAGRELARIREAAWGTTPADAALTRVRTLPGLSMVRNPSHFRSEEINANRIIQKIRQVSNAPSWTIPMEVIYGNIDSFLELVFQDEWSTDALSESNTFLSDTLEANFGDAVTAFYIQQKGCVAAGMTLNIDGTGESPVSAEITGLAKEHLVTTTTLDTDATNAGVYDDAAAGDPMVAAQCAIEIDDTAATLLRASMTFNPNMEVLRAIGTPGPARIAPAGFRTVSLEFDVFLEDKTWPEKELTDNEIKFETFLRDAASSYNEIAITVPKARILTAVPSGGAGSQTVRVTAEAHVSAVTVARTAAE